jgi:hypothetical protein
MRTVLFSLLALWGFAVNAATVQEVLANVSHNLDKINSYRADAIVSQRTS